MNKTKDRTKCNNKMQSTQMKARKDKKMMGQTKNKQYNNGYKTVWIIIFNVNEQNNLIKNKDCPRD